MGTRGHFSDGVSNSKTLFATLKVKGNKRTDFRFSYLVLRKTQLEVHFRSKTELSANPSHPATRLADISPTEPYRTVVLYTIYRLRVC